MGCEYVLVTGTHENTPQVVNTLYGKSGVVRTDSWPRLPGSYHGSGCTLASAIAAMLANGLDLPEAVREAQDYTWQALEKAYRPGMGQYIPTGCSGRARKPSARGDDAEAPRAADVRGTPLSAAARDAERRAGRAACCGLYAVTPDVRRHRGARRAGRGRDRRRRLGDPVPQQVGVRRAAARAGARARAPLPRRAARCSSSTTMSRSRATSTPTACTSARTTATSRAARRCVGAAG